MKSSMQPSGTRIAIVRQKARRGTCKPSLGRTHPKMDSNGNDEQQQASGVAVGRRVGSEHQLGRDADRMKRESGGHGQHRQHGDDNSCTDEGTGSVMRPGAMHKVATSEKGRLNLLNPKDSTVACQG